MATDRVYGSDLAVYLDKTHTTVCALLVLFQENVLLKRQIDASQTEQGAQAEAEGNEDLSQASSLSISAVLSV